MIEKIHPVIGARILKSWDFPRALSDVPLLYLDYQREQAAADYSDVVQIASLLNTPIDRRPSISKLPSYERLGMDRLDPPLLGSELEDARVMLA